MVGALKKIVNYVVDLFRDPVDSTTPRRHKSIIDWHSPEGKERFLVTRYNQAYFTLATWYQPPRNPFFCGIACITTVLNALHHDKKKTKKQEELTFHYYNSSKESLDEISLHAYAQSSLLNTQTDFIKDRGRIAPENYTNTSSEDPSITLKQMADIFEVYHTKAHVFHAQDDQEAGSRVFREHVRASLNQPGGGSFVVVNYDGQPLGLESGGHFSIIGAYHEASDSILIVDAVPYRTPWYWVPVKLLYEGMNSLDRSTKRGYVVISDKE